MRNEVMRISMVFLLILIFCIQLRGQVLQIEYNGDPLSKEEREKVEKMFLHEAEFYMQFGLPDSLTLVHLYMFDKKEVALSYLESIGFTKQDKLAGVYLTGQNKVVILGRNKDPYRALAIIYHELSHHFVRHIIGVHVPYWFNEGLARYFDHCVMKKKGLRHSLTDYELGRIRTMYMLGELDLSVYLNSSNHDKFMIEQYTNDQYSYILAHALVTFWIEKLPRELLKKFIANLKEGDKSSTVSEQIDNIYPGGFKQFEKDFAAFVHNDN